MKHATAVPAINCSAFADGLKARSFFRGCSPGQQIKIALYTHTYARCQLKWRDKWMLCQPFRSRHNADRQNCQMINHTFWKMYTLSLQHGKWRGWSWREPKQILIPADVCTKPGKHLSNWFRWMRDSCASSRRNSDCGKYGVMERFVTHNTLLILHVPFSISVLPSDYSRTSINSSMRGSGGEGRIHYLLHKSFAQQRFQWPIDERDSQHVFVGVLNTRNVWANSLQYWFFGDDWEYTLN